MSGRMLSPIRRRRPRRRRARQLGRMRRASIVDTWIALGILTPEEARSNHIALIEAMFLTRSL